jgi:hypothetical protein
MRNLVLSTAVSFTMLGGSAALADDFIKGVYLESQELCAQAKKDSLQQVIDDGNTMLTASGLEATEYNCQFLQVSKSKASPGWLVGALCEIPDEMFPDLLTIRASDDKATELELVSIKLVDPSNGGGNSDTYYLCDGVPVP